jgi:hypothetical protein
MPSFDSNLELLAASQRFGALQTRRGSIVGNDPKDALALRLRGTLVLTACGGARLNGLAQQDLTRRRYACENKQSDTYTPDAIKHNNVPYLLETAASGYMPVATFPRSDP